jgi:addiction module HigA family antidote
LTHIVVRATLRPDKKKALGRNHTERPAGGVSTMAPMEEHPGEVLAQKLEGLGGTPTEIGRQLQVPANRMMQIINGNHATTGASALGLAHWFGLGAEFWIHLETRHDLRIGRLESGRLIAQMPHCSTKRSAAIVRKQRRGLASHGR